MRFSLNLAQDFSDLDLNSIPRDELLLRMGAQLGAIEDATDYAPRYKDIVVVKVVECEKHPNADKLSLCRVDDGGVTQNVERGKDGLVQVVCGAPNVHADMFAAWIPPNATVPSSLDTDPFVLEARELRGKVSNGMLASAHELDISDNHDGILELLEEEVGRSPVVGEPITNFYGLDDFVIDCENKMFTHRPDCFGNLGIAREVAGIFGQKYESPEWYSVLPHFSLTNTQVIEVANKIPEKVPRFTIVAMGDIKVHQSPVWLQALLKRVGIKSINNVVDITNYVMHLTGQPLHAFDLDKLKKVSKNLSLMPRMAKKDEKLKLLNGKEITLTTDDMVIATDSHAVALAGVMGGSETEVDENTKNIVIECANFDMYTVRRTSMRHGLFTDAVTRFNKGQSPLQNDRVLAFALEQMGLLADAAQSSIVYDLTSFDVTKSNLNTVETTVEFINSRLGSELSGSEIKKLLENVEFNVSLQGDGITVIAPFWRMDIAIAEDIVEEVGRLYGYDKLPIVLPARSTKPSPRNKLLDFAQNLRETLKESGANEVLTYSFVHGDLMRNSGVDPDKWAYHLRNAISPDLQYYRTSLTPSLLAKVHGNIKQQAGQENNEFMLFEIGKVHVKGEFEKEKSENKLPKQMRRVTGVFAADDKAAKKYEGSAYYQAKKYVDLITDGQATYLPLDTNEYPVTAPYQQARAAVVAVHDQVLGVVGEFNGRTSKALKLPAFCAGFELDIDLLKEHLEQSTYRPLSTFPSTRQDITFEVDKHTSWGSLEQLIHAELAVAKAELGYDYSLTALDIFQSEGADKKRLSLRVELTHSQKTLKTEEVNKLLDQLSKAAKENLHATRI